MVSLITEHRGHLTDSNSADHRSGWIDAVPSEGALQALHLTALHLGVKLHEDATGGLSNG
jgi:hypothetical protein